MNLSQMRYAVALARYRSFSTAAEKLYIAQPTLSQQIRSLEEEIATDLFRRTTRSVVPTDAGLEFCSYAETILDQLGRLESAMRKYSAEMKGTLRLGLLWSFSYLSIDTLLNEFRNLYPEIRISLVIDGTLRLYEMLENRQIDAAFINRTEKINLSVFQFTPVISSPLCVIISQKDALSLKSSVSAEDLIGKNVLLPGENSSIREYLNSLLAEKVNRINIMGSSSQIDTCINIAASNLGISFVSRDIISHFETKDIKAVPFTPQIIRTTGLLIEKQNLRDPMICGFREYVKNYFDVL